MDKELLKALGDLLDEKLVPIKDDIKSIKGDIKNLNDDVKGMKDDIKNIKGDLKNIKGDIKNLNDDVKSMKDDIKNIKSDVKALKTQQEESLSILRSLEHKAEVNKSEHDKLLNDIANLSGTVENMRKDLCAVEVVTARNFENIAQLKLVK